MWWFLHANMFHYFKIPYITQIIPLILKSINFFSFSMFLYPYLYFLQKHSSCKWCYIEFFNIMHEYPMLQQLKVVQQVEVPQHLLLKMEIHRNIPSSASWKCWKSYAPPPGNNEIGHSPPPPPPLGKGNGNGRTLGGACGIGPNPPDGIGGSGGKPGSRGGNPRRSWKRWWFFGKLTLQENQTRKPAQCD